MPKNTTPSQTATTRTAEEQLLFRARSALGGKATEAARDAERIAALDSLPDLDSPETALKALAVIVRLSIRGFVAGAQANAAAQAARSYIDSHRVVIAVQRVKALEKRLTQLEAENAQLRGALR